MPELKPFQALRYTDTAGDMSRLIAPPYDVIDELHAADLRARSPYNCVRLILPEGPAEIRYRDAAEELGTWIDEGLLACDDAPAVYVYRQTFTHRGAEVTRHAVFCELRLSPLDAGHVLPHERTHAGPKRDRLALTLATRAQLSPIFLIARDPEAQMLELAREATERSPEFSATTDDGIRHELWVLADDAARALCSAAGSHPVLIADGHHRYETALVAADELGDNVKAAFLLVCLVSERDPGLIVQPTHRVLATEPVGVTNFDWLESLDSDFALLDLGPLEAAEAEARAAQEGGGCLVVMPGGAGSRAWLATPREAALEAMSLGSRRGRLAPVVFDALVLQRLYRLDADGASRAGILSYARSPEDAVGVAGPSGCAFFLPPVAIDDVWATAGEGSRLPQKSTYFEPKIPSGLLFRTLQADPTPP